MQEKRSDQQNSQAENKHHAMRDEAEEQHAGQQRCKAAPETGVAPQPLRLNPAKACRKIEAQSHAAAEESSQGFPEAPRQRLDICRSLDRSETVADRLDHGGKQIAKES